jgi:hypothetical protein
MVLSILPGAALGPILLLLAVLASDAWVFVDAKARLDRGSPVAMTVGSFRIDAPFGWFLGCLVLWLLFFPMYLVSRAG